MTSTPRTIRTRAGARDGRSALLPVLAVAACQVFLAQAQSQSSSYVLQQSSCSSAGGAMSSGAYRLGGSLGPEAAIGVSSSPHLVLQSGFWSFSGSGLVPVYLLLYKSPFIEGQIDLLWTGNNPPYTIYRSADCSQVFSSVFATESSNSQSDPAPLPAALSCYNVLATAPGPIAPP